MEESCNSILKPFTLGKIRDCRESSKFPVLLLLPETFNNIKYSEIFLDLLDDMIIFEYQDEIISGLLVSMFSFENEDFENCTFMYKSTIPPGFKDLSDIEVFDYLKTTLGLRNKEFENKPLELPLIKGILEYKITEIFPSEWPNKMRFRETVPESDYFSKTYGANIKKAYQIENRIVYLEIIPKIDWEPEKLLVYTNGPQELINIVLSNLWIQKNLLKQ